MILESARTSYNTGNQLKEAGKLDEAIGHYQQALQVQPDCVEALNQLGAAYYLQGKIGEAIALVQQAIKIQPDFAEAYKTLGNLLQAQGKLDAAMRAYTKAIEIKPDLAEAHANLGSMFYQQGRLDEAIASYKRAVALKPDLAGAYWNLGNVSNQLGRLGEAIAYWQRALALKPDLGGAEFQLKLGNAFLVLDKFDEAIKSFQRAIALKPDSAEALASLGSALLRQGDLQGEIAAGQFNLAVNSLLKAIAIQPDLTLAHQELWRLIVSLGTEDNQFAPLRRMADRYLQVGGEVSQLMGLAAGAIAYLKSGLNATAREKFTQIDSQISQKPENLNPFNIAALYSSILFSAPHFRDDLKANTSLFGVLAKPYSHYLEESVKSRQAKPDYSRQKISGESPLKIGFLSKHFRRHSVGWCSADIIGELAHLTPHIHLYITDPLKADELTQKFEKAAAKLHLPQKALGDSHSAVGVIVEQILKNEIDILVDLDSITVPIQPAILYKQPAPICISWLGFEPPFLSEENYFLTDWHAHPDGTEKLYTEQLVRMPDSFVAVSGFESRAVNAEAVRKAMRIGSDQVVYLCVSAASKLNSELIEAQVKILKEVPDSLLLYKGLGDAEVVRAAYKQACESQGVGFQRVKFLERSPSEEEHRTIYQIADILLDSYPYNGGTHNLEALWFNLPMVTRVGEQGLARMGYSFLKSLGIEAGIAHSWEGYVSWGIRLGQDAALRQEIREKLFKSKQQDSLAPLWNPKKFAADMYAVFEELLARKIAAVSS